MTTIRIANQYDTVSPPIPGYHAVTFQVLLNPSRTVLELFDQGGFSADASETATLHALRSLIENNATATKDRKTYQARLQELEGDIAARQERMGSALHALFGTSTPLVVETDGGSVTLDFTSPAAALATMENKDLPDELAFWLAQLPLEIPQTRRRFVAENLGKSFSGVSKDTSEKTA